MEYSVITVVGPDSIGIMETISSAVAETGANIEETRASILGGEFAVIMLVSGKAGGTSALETRLPGLLSKKGLTVIVRRTVGPARSGGLPYIIESISLDTPGIVRAMTGVLLERGLNIEDLESTVSAAPLTGSPMFRMRIMINISPGPKLIALREELSRVAEEHDLDISVRPLRSSDKDCE
jgi:glycine cleavage system transcriptional repressor